MSYVISSCYDDRAKHEGLRKAIFDGGPSWVGVDGCEQDWDDEVRTIAFTVASARGGGLYVAFNAAHTPQVRHTIQKPQCPSLCSHCSNSLESGSCLERAYGVSLANWALPCHAVQGWPLCAVVTRL